MEGKFAQLKTHLRVVQDLRSVSSLMYWDQSTYMPRGGGAARARQLATVNRLAHEKFTSPVVGELLAELALYEQALPYDSDEASLIRVARRDYERAVKVPAGFKARVAEHQVLSYEAWAKARPANDFSIVRPFLEKTLDLSQEYANFFPGYEHIADPLIEDSDYGMKAHQVCALFADLRGQLVPLVEAIAAQPVSDDSCLKRVFPEDQQLAFGLELTQRFGYDLARGRQDKTLHPFMIKFSLGDVRITIRVKENDLGEALFSALHESGHAMYEQGIHQNLEGTLLAEGASAGLHESQSRLWENLVGRSLGFWTYWYPRLQDTFHTQLRSVPLETFYRAINKVERSLIRTDADEVTYNLHVIIRFDLELAMLEGKLEIRHLPEAWRERYRSDLGVFSVDDRDGVLQDVHWFDGLIGGAFQGYALGNILSAQIYDTCLKAHPEIPAEIRAGRFDTLHGWLRQNIYRHGRKHTPNQLVEQATGNPIQISPYLDYLWDKYGSLYHLNTPR